MRLRKYVILSLTLLLFSQTLWAKTTDQPYEESLIYNFSDERLTIVLVSEDKSYRLGKNHQMKLTYHEPKKLLRVYIKDKKICEYVVDDRYDIFITGTSQIRCSKRAERIPKEF